MRILRRAALLGVGLVLLLAARAGAQTCNPLTDSFAQAAVDVIANDDRAVAAALVSLEDQCIATSTCATAAYRQARVQAVLDQGYRWDCTARRYVPDPSAATTTTLEASSTTAAPTTVPPTTAGPTTTVVTTSRPPTTSVTTSRPPTTVVVTSRPATTATVPGAGGAGPATSIGATTSVVTSVPGGTTSSTGTTSTSTSTSTSVRPTTSSSADSTGSSTPPDDQQAIDTGDEGGGPSVGWAALAVLLAAVGVTGGVLVARDLRRS